MFKIVTEHAGPGHQDAWDVDGISSIVLARYVAGHGSPGERQQVTQWLAASSSHATELERWRQSWAAERPSVGHLSQAFDSAAGVARVRALVAKQRDVRPAIRLPYAAGAAAALVLALGIAATLGRLGLPAHSVPSTRDYVTGPAQRLSVTLSDGSRFVLAPASRLRVPVAYGRAGRNVQLEGEAYFAVIHDVRHPFTVGAANAVTTDVGTEFDIRAYAADPAVRIAVADGGVLVQTSVRGSAVSVSAGHAMEVDAHGSASVVRQADVAALTAWTQGRLVFDATPLNEVVRGLARWYDADLRVGDAELGTHRVTATLHDQPLADVLALVTAATRSHAVQVGRTITLLPINAPHR